ncbi:MAG: DNA translocase FtsK [Dehalococcoidales bacterium]|nr:DNA translocase FtsK [Dehalococcoidales bacterium]
MSRDKDKKRKEQTAVARKVDKKKASAEKYSETKAPRKRFNPLKLLTKVWFWLILLVLIAGGLLYWQWDNVVDFVWDVAASTMGLFGWGVVLIGLAVLIILVVVFRHEIAAFAQRWKLYQWNKWLGAAAWFAAIWGFLGILELGGAIGDAIINGDKGYIGWLIVVGLVLGGFILLFPGLVWRGLKATVKGIVGIIKLPAPRPKTSRPVQEEFKFNYPPTVTENRVVAGDRTEKSAIPEKAPLGIKPPSVLIPPEIMPGKKYPDIAPETIEKPKQPSPEKQSAAPRAALKTGEGARDVKDVARDVWRKYGESSDLVLIDGWKLPPIDILDLSPEVDFGQADNSKRARLIEEALESYGVEAKVVQVNAGPTVTQFGIEPGWDRKFREIKDRDEEGNVVIRQEEVSRTRVKVERITALSNNLALALAVPGVRIEAPIPGKALVGIEVPNANFGIVSLRSVIESANFQKILGKSNLALALGKGAGGESIAGDLAKMPHLLVAGSTGSGKTVCLNAIVCCLLMCNSPADLKFILIDPKRVELVQYNSLPHLATKVVVDTDKALNTLRWLSQEMDNRYKTLSAVGARNIEAYNKKVPREKKMPNLVLVIDELADLMMTGFAEVEHILCRLAQLARAVGIHLVVATQRPSVDVITGLIKANFPTRISFAVTSQVDSRTILDSTGAEKLLGRGDMLYLPTEEAKPRRLQGCFVSDPEVERLVYFWGTQKQEQAATLNLDELASLEPSIKIQETAAPADPLITAARKLAEEHSNISTSFLQRKLHIGYPRAARIMEQLQEEMGDDKTDENGAEIEEERSGDSY